MPIGAVPSTVVGVGGVKFAAATIFSITIVRVIGTFRLEGCRCAGDSDRAPRPMVSGRPVHRRGGL
jgi:hypothetical protein